VRKRSIAYGKKRIKNFGGAGAGYICLRGIKEIWIGMLTDTILETLALPFHSFV
jgi:hypothetical protein